LAELGIVPGAEISIVAVAPFNGPLTLQVDDEHQIVGHNIAKIIQVQTPNGKKHASRCGEGSHRNRKSNTPLGARRSLLICCCLPCMLLFPFAYKPNHKIKGYVQIMDYKQRMKQVSWLRIRRSLFLFIPLLLLLGLFVPLLSQAHIVPEEAWHPAPAAYLRSLFYANFKPTNWALIAEEYETVVEPEYTKLFETTYEVLEPASTVEGFDHATAIQEAIESQDKAGLYLASTRAISQLTRYYLAEAETKLTKPGAATKDVEQAQRIYRAFQNFIPQADPKAAKRLALGWLDLSSSVGHAGISGIGGTASDPDKFEAAREEIESYLIDNFEADALGELSHGSLAPIPATKMDENISLTRWVPPGTNLNDQDPLPLLALNFEERGFDETDLPLVAYGDMLFDSPAIFGEPARGMNMTCSRCHNRSDINKEFFIPGVSHQPGAADVDGGFFNPLFNDQRNDSLDIPTLRGIRFTGPYGRDGRFASLREFTRNVIVSEFAGEEPTPFMLDTLVAYMLEFDWQPNSLLNKDGSLNDNASEAALRGEVLFNTPSSGMNGQSCSTCHIASANFIDRLPHDIGSGEPASEFARDSAFDTPTLINVASTGPYFHDGSLATLREVVEWFDDNFSLSLTEGDKADLTAYLEAVGAADNPWELFDEENTPFALDWAELSTFLTTLDILIPAEDSSHAILLLDTVAPDLRLDAGGASDRYVIPQVYEIADMLDEIKAAIEDEDWELAAELNEEYKALADAYGPSFK
jgi:hypothetical protein